MKIKETTTANANRIGIWLLVIGIFLLPYNIRNQFCLTVLDTNRTYLWSVNVCAYAGMFLLYVAHYRPNESVKKWWAHVCEWLPLLAVIPIFISLTAAGFSLGYIAVTYMLVLLPIFIINIKLPENAVRDMASVVILILNIILILLVIEALIDKLFNYAAIKWLASFMTCDRFTEFAHPHNDETRRFFSMYGHPLVTGCLANSIYVLNHVGRSRKIKFSFFDFFEMILVAIVDVCTGGRAGIAVFAGLTLLIFYKNLYMMISAVILGALAYFAGFFDGIIKRFNYSTIDSKRLEHIKGLLNNDTAPIKIFSGYGSVGDMEKLYRKLHSAFEQPAVVFSFYYGVITAILLIFIPLVLVSVKLLKKKRFNILFMWLLLFAQENVTPWISLGYDEPWRLYFFTFLIVSIALLEPVNNKKLRE